MNRKDPALRCEEALELLEPFLDGDLPPQEEERLRVHLEGCASCAAELDLAGAVQRELRSLPLHDCPPEVLEKVRSAGGAVVPFRPRLSRFRVAAAAALLAVAIGAGAFFARPVHQGPDPEEVARATAEARYALAYIGKVSRQTGLELRDDVLRRHLGEPERP
ncbi:MAG TPA: zf-HC2 domain-containing protein [Thermoanaerobaculia bacterium]|nr:zf-HC2 domain-containing protein [Thermoanaerobaculia bacterium]